MADENSDDAAPQQADAPKTGEQVAQAVTINAQYIKDLSFEAPNTPGVLINAQSTAPDIKINVDVQASGVKDSTYEVVLVTHAECKMDNSTAFIVELSYGGLFTLNLPDEHLKPVLLIECPRLLFPFVRNVIADVTRDGGFPPLMLNPLDFAAMYRDGIKQDGAEPPTSTKTDT